MAYPDEFLSTGAATSSDMGWWDSLVESTGEIVGGAVDVVGGFGGDWLGIKMDGELDRAKSSNPDENRSNNNDYQQPNGAPVQVSGQGMQWQTLMIVALVLVVVLGGAYVAMKGGK
ncbi:hypothetical protein [Vibrio methylphosphonaticus]|uniref:hypothetical protein n=1 Tax=Vibrio methylphosphonaticus TaxID=2946866 RepID=UPI002029C190|nr:hypothetical protein [Vibrio methylphosphonaticus]MCL9777057.1 hypothetical protein [Vibrio methylphosphonaticus]